MELTATLTAQAMGNTSATVKERGFVGQAIMCCLSVALIASQKPAGINAVRTEQGYARRITTLRSV